METTMPAKPERPAHRMRAAALTMAASLLADPALADSLFKTPSIGLAPPNVVRTVPPATVPPLDANQCLLMSGTCPLGRVQRAGGRCYCASPGGGVRAGTTRVRPQGANPSSLTPGP